MNPAILQLAPMKPNYFEEGFSQSGNPYLIFLPLPSLTFEP